jgi:uncharacterized RDD family membrane protein YckC
MSRRIKHQREKGKPATLLDRFGMALLSGLLAFLSAFAIWALIAIGRYGSGLVLPFGPVIWFTAAMAGLGFLTAESLLVTIFGKVWYALYVLLAEEKPPNQS